MEFKQVLDRRMSCRSFLDRQVDEATLKSVVEAAQRCPSWGNTQPWKVYAAAGDAAARIRQGILAAHDQGAKEEPEVTMPATFGDLLMNRYRSLGMALFEVLGIGRGDKDKRKKHYRNNFNAFGAPCLAYFTAPAGESPYVVYDVGALVAVFCLAAADAGLDSCILAALARYPGPARQVLPIGQDEQIVIGVALGYGDEKAEVNRFRSGREPLEQVLSLTGF